MPILFKRFTLPVTAILLLVVVFLVPNSKAAPPGSVTLTYFRGESVADGVRLQWQTATELQTAGFKILRGDSGSGPFRELSEIGILPAQGSATSGGDYDSVDATAEEGQTYWYRLVEIEFDGSEHTLQTISVESGAAGTATVEGIATTDSGGESETTAGSATATPLPSPTATDGAVTNTPRATATPDESESNDMAMATAPTGDATPAQAERDGIVEAADPTRGLERPPALAQATEGYPGATATESIQEDDSYPGAEPSATPILIEATVDEFPGGLAPGTTPEVTPDSRFENAVGASGGNAASGDTQAGETQPLSRVLLWVGFIAALLIFIAGATFSIILSTRKQRSDV